MDKNNERWHGIWNARSADIKVLDDMGEFELYKELKRADGYDVAISNSDGYYESFYKSIIDVYEKLRLTDNSAYEVGSGSGANLLIFQNRGWKVGGIDYSESLCKIASNIFFGHDIAHGEAINLDVTVKYDAVISDGVFAYFPNEEYARQVLDKMIRKANHHVIILEVFDKTMEDACLAYRRSQIKNYDELYQGLDKMFYNRDMFEKLAKQYNCKIEFSNFCNDYYWNSKYMYNVFFTKQ